MVLGGVEVYLLLAATLGVHSFHKGYSALAIAGIVFPVLWLVGVFLRAKPNSYYQQHHPAKAGPRISVATAATQQAPDRKQEAERPGGRPESPAATEEPQELADAHAAAADLVPNKWSTSVLTPVSCDERTRQQLLFLRWLLATGRLEP